MRPLIYEHHRLARAPKPALAPAVPPGLEGLTVGHSPFSTTLVVARDVRGRPRSIRRAQPARIPD